MKWFARRRIRRALARQSVTYDEWRRACRGLVLLRHLGPVERARLRALAAGFLHAKAINGARGLAVSRYMALVIATQACVPVLNLGLDWYRGWVEVILYPGPFAVEHEEVDHSGVVTRRAEIRHGESWSRGPLILSWEDVRRDLQDPQPGYNVVVHECAHKLDVLDGRADGLPPLARDMTATAWARIMGEAYEDLRRHVDSGKDVPLDPYAGTDPAEFFAVVSEYFFTAPAVLATHYPGVYDELARFYRQDPNSYNL